MKKLPLLIVLLSTLFSSHLFARNGGVKTNADEASIKTGLRNSKGQMLANSGDTLLSRDFFRAKWVAVQCSRLLRKEETIMVVFQPPAGQEARVYKLNNQRFCEEMLTRIFNSQPLTVITVIVGSRQGEIPTQGASAFRIILK